MGQLKTAVIMAGGQGTRLQSVTGVLPKPMVNIRNTTIENFGKAKDTILEHQIDMLSENGITNFILVVGNKKEYIQAAFTNEIINHNIPGRNITIRYFAEDRPLGTAGAFCSRELQDMIQEDDFLFTYADVLFDINVGKMFELHDKERADATVLISPCSEPDDRPLCVCEKGSNIISGIIPKQGKTDGPRGGSFPNTPKNGIMILNKSALQLLPSQPTYLDMEESILTRLIYSGAYKVCAWNTPCYIKDIGTVDRYYEGVSELARNIPELRNPAKNPQKCVIFKAKDLIKVTPEGIAVLDTELADSIKMLNDSGIITAVYKDNPQIAIHPQQDWLIDTMLVRDGDGAFLNTRFGEEQVEEFNAQMAEWNVAPQNIVQVDIMPKGCLLSHMDGTRQMFGDAETAMKDILGTHSIQDFGGQGDDE